MVYQPCIFNLWTKKSHFNYAYYIVVAYSTVQKSCDMEAFPKYTLMCLEASGIAWLLEHTKA